MKSDPIYKAAQTLEKVARKAHDQKLGLMARDLLMRSRGVSIQRILDKVPGKTVTAKCETLGVTRQAWYDWAKGLYRPTGKQAHTLAKVTGYSVKAIAGGDVKPLKRAKPKKAAKPRKRRTPHVLESSEKPAEAAGPN